MGLKKSFWKGKKVLVTGGAGLVGSWLSMQLASEGARVSILDIKSKLPKLGEPYDKYLQKSTFIRGDVRNEKLLSKVFTRGKFETVFHLAAWAIVDEVLANPAEALDVNIMGTVRILEEARKHKGVHVVVASSDKAYGPQKTLPYKEHFPLRGEFHPYDCSKSSTDQITRMYANVYKLPCAVARCGNIYGGGDFNFSRLIPGTIKSMFEGKPIEIRSDGTYRREYIYIEDAVSCYMCLGQNLLSGKIHGRAFNFGYNKPLSVIEVVETIYELSDMMHLKPVILNTAKFEIPHQYLDATQAKKELGWKPEHKLEKGLLLTIAWYKRHFKI